MPKPTLEKIESNNNNDDTDNNNNDDTDNNNNNDNNKSENQTNNNTIVSTQPIPLLVLETIAIASSSLKDFIFLLTKLSKFSYQALISARAVQERLRQLILETVKSLKYPLSELQIKHLGSALVQHRIQTKGLTVKQAIDDTAPTAIPVTPVVYLGGRYGLAENYSSHTAIGLGLTSTEAQYTWMSQSHVDALTAGIAFEEIERLTHFQVQAILLTRSKPDTINLTSTTITATSTAMSSSSNANAPQISPLTRQDVEGVNLTSLHIDMIKKGLMSFEKIKCLINIQAEALLCGFTEADLQEEWFSEKHVAIVKKKLFTTNKVRGLSEVQIDALEMGYPPATSKTFTPNTLTALRHNFTLTQIADPRFAKLMQLENFEPLMQQLAASGVQFKHVVALDPIQIALIYPYQLTFQQVTSPRALKMIRTYKTTSHHNRVYILSQIIKSGAGFNEEHLTLTVAQQTLLSDYGCTMPQVTHPYIVKLLKDHENKGYNFEHTIGKLLSQGLPIEQIEKLTSAQLKLMSKTLCTFEIATDPHVSKILQDYNDEESPYGLLWSVLQKYTPGEIQDLNKIQIEALDRANATLAQVQHPNFSKNLLQTWYDTKYDFDALLNLQAWQRSLLGFKIPLEEVQKPNEKWSPLHTLVLGLNPDTPCYPKIKDLDGSQLLGLLAIPYAQQAKPSTDAQQEVSPIMTFSNAGTSAAAALNSNNSNLGQENNNNNNLMGQKKRDCT